MSTNSSVATLHDGMRTPGASEATREGTSILAYGALNTLLFHSDEHSR